MTVVTDEIGNFDLGMRSRSNKDCPGHTAGPLSSTLEAMPPTLGNGKVCYVQIPTTDIARSAEFYRDVFGWNIRQRGDGTTAFDDGVGEVSGEWVLGRPPSEHPGLLIYIMVDSVAATVESVINHGGEIVQPIGGDPGETTARFRDPGGNVMGLYQEPG